MGHLHSGYSRSWNSKLEKCFEDENYSGHCYDGTLDITKCMKNAPVIMSSPHFYQVNGKNVLTYCKLPDEQKKQCLASKFVIISELNHE